MTRGAHTLERGHRLWPFNLIESDFGGVRAGQSADDFFFFTCSGLRGLPVIVGQINAQLISQQL